MGKRIKLDEDTTLLITNGDVWKLECSSTIMPIYLGVEARERLLAALLMEEGS